MFYFSHIKAYLTTKKKRGNTVTNQEKLIIGYVRVSTPKQTYERQIINIKAEFPNAIIIKETYTGTTTSRPAWNKIMRQSRKGNIKCIVFDEVSRMSRNADEGFNLYKKLFNMGVELIFLKEKHINTSVYQNAINNQIKLQLTTGDTATDQLMSSITKALNDYVMDLAEKQISIAFDRAQAEVDLLHKRTSEGMKAAKLMGSQIGRIPGRKYPSRKSIKAKKIILKHYKGFKGDLSAKECIKLSGITRSTFYRYVSELQVNKKHT